MPAKTPKRSTTAKARGRKGRGQRANRIPNPITHHACHICGKRRVDAWNKVPRLKYGAQDKAAHPYCVKERQP